MGNDGGSIPKRRELVKEAAKAPTAAQIKETRAESQEHAWNHCALSSKPLAAPVVSDCLGTLYNKDSVLEFLLAEEGSAEKVKGKEVLGGRVKGLKDVVEVKFEVGEHEVVHLKPGQPAEISVDALEGERFEGEVVQIAQQALITLHVTKKAGVNTHHVLEASFKGLARCLRDAVRVEGGGVPSTKGAL